MYTNVWLAFVDIEAKSGNEFNELIDIEGNQNHQYIGAWGNILIISDRINDVADLIEAGLGELDLAVKFIDKIENVASLVEYEEIKEDVLTEVDWLLSSTYKFKISNKLFPYLE